MENKINPIVFFKNTIVWFALLVITGTAGTWFLLDRIQKERSQLAEAETESQTIAEQLKSFDQIKESADSIANDRKELENMVVTSDNTLELIKDLEQAAGASGVKLKTKIGGRPQVGKEVLKSVSSLVQAGDKKEAASREVWLELEVDGGFANILQFVRYLENSKKLIAVQTMTLNKNQSLNSETLPSSQENLPTDLKAQILISA